ncbi:hypothetical protein MHU86_12041 [Fragilaria crotonensis]|nr:hypothetical protein MHU86_12041 [Fragilaria crotonensis]
MEPAAVRTALVRIGFVEAAALALTEEQGLDSLDEIRILSDDDIANLCKLLRRPGVVQGYLTPLGTPSPIQESKTGQRRWKLFLSTYVPIWGQEDSFGLRRTRSEDVPAADPEGGYATLQDEMIARAPHFSLVAGVRTADPAYLINREKVWDVIARITRSHDCWTYVKPAQRTRDGRKAYLALYAHYLGPNNVDNMASQAESS